MQKYVRDKDPGQNGNALGGQTQYGDLKVEHRKASAAANSHRSRSKGQPTNQPSQVQRHSRSQHRAQQTLCQPNEQGAFYDTDASSIGGTSTTVSAKHSHAGAARTPQNRPTNGSSGSSEASNSADGSGDEYEEGYEEELLDVRPGDPPRLNQKQQHLMATDFNHAFMKLPDGSSLPRIPGDSYPNTTSGRPSEVDPAEKENQTQHDHKTQGSLPYNGQKHQVPMRVPLDVQDHSQARRPPAEQHQDRRTDDRGLLVRSTGLPGDMLEHEVNANFAFAKPARPSKPERPSPAVDQQTVPEPTTPKPSASTNTAQQASPPIAYEPSNQRPHNQQYGPENARDYPVSPKHPHRSKVEHKIRESAPPRQQYIETGPEYEQFSDADANVQSDIASDAQSQAKRQQPVVKLDYEPPELFDMDYQDLKGQSFDIDPGTSEFKLPAEQQNASLDSKLSTVAVFPPPDQAGFFSSLSMSEWEQAGEWFLGRFGEVFSKLRDTRQQKRKAAKFFEDEMEGRHGAVNKKRKQTVDSLSEMKESGGKVFQATPKKKKTNTK